MSAKLAAVLATFLIAIAVTVAVTVHLTTANSDAQRDQAARKFIDKSMTHAQDAGGFSVEKKS